MPRARHGKVAVLPAKIREKVNQMLFDGKTMEAICAWLAKQKAARDALRERGYAEILIGQNISHWRKGGYQEWLAKKDQVNRLKELSTHAAELAKAGDLTIAEGASAIASGSLLQLLEQTIRSLAASAESGKDLSPKKLATMTEALGDLVNAISKLRGLDNDAKKLRLDERKADQKDQELKLAQDRFELQTAEKLLDYARDPAVAEILNSRKAKPAKIADLRKHLFG